MTEHTALRTIAEKAATMQPRVAVVLGSGWGELAQHVLNPIRIPYTELAGFPQATVAGHAGELCLGHIGAVPVAVMSGRKHGYESGAVDGMKVPLHVLQQLGCQILVQTNAAGSLRTDLPPQSVVALSDHINLPQRSPLVGERGSERFVSMAGAYDLALREHARSIAAQRGVVLKEGVYAWAFGPQFETPAEIRMMALLGADTVGMSTVPETILARHLGMRVLALSLITNMGAGLSQEDLSHAHTLAQADMAAKHASGLLAAIISSLVLTP